MRPASMKKPGMTLGTNEDYIISPEMVDSDQGKEPFLAGGGVVEGIAGTRSIDTLYENTSCDYVENPREGSTPAPACLIGGMYPNRRL
jgi:hypothetical protein